MNIENIKPVRFLADSLDKLCAIPPSDTREAGYQIRCVAGPH